MCKVSFYASWFGLFMQVFNWSSYFRNNGDYDDADDFYGDGNDDADSKPGFSWNGEQQPVHSSGLCPFCQQEGFFSITIVIVIIITIMIIIIKY